MQCRLCAYHQMNGWKNHATMIGCVGLKFCILKWNLKTSMQLQMQRPSALHHLVDEIDRHVSVFCLIHLSYLPSRLYIVVILVFQRGDNTVNTLYTHKVVAGNITLITSIGETVNLEKGLLLWCFILHLYHKFEKEIPDLLPFFLTLGSNPSDY